MEDKKILVSLTTLSEKKISADWRSMIKEINELKVDEIALFLTVAKRLERQEIYKELEKSTVKNIPHVHIRTSMKPEELGYLTERFNAEVFNLHSPREWPLLHDYSEHASRIYLENSGPVPSDEELNKFAGLCVDFAHWEDRRLMGDTDYCREMEKQIKKYKIGCCHVSAILKKPENVSPHYSGREQYDTHLLRKAEDVEYIKRYVQYLPEYISLELENPIAEQLEAQAYLEKIIRQSR